VRVHLTRLRTGSCGEDGGRSEQGSEEEGSGLHVAECNGKANQCEKSLFVRCIKDKVLASEPRGEQ
jgi:hypothetical protein